ncbi:MAG: hypothetical protein ACK4P3_06175 [Fimbriimonadaceae bacterium]
MKLTHMATVALLAVVTLAGSLLIDAQDGKTIAVTAPRIGTVAIPSEEGVARRTGQVIQINFRNFPPDTETAQWFRHTPKEGDVRLQIDLFDRSGAPVAPGEYRLAGSTARQAVIRVIDFQASTILTVPPTSTGSVTVKKIDGSGISGSISFTSPDSSVIGSFQSIFN